MNVSNCTVYYTVQITTFNFYHFDAFDSINFKHILIDRLGASTSVKFKNCICIFALVALLLFLLFCYNLQQHISRFSQLSLRLHVFTISLSYHIHVRAFKRLKVSFELYVPQFNISRQTIQLSYLSTFSGICRTPGNICLFYMHPRQSSATWRHLLGLLLEVSRYS